jgi:threonine dehydrogenase-like Zn-dependent dehydrogenase
MRGIKTPNAAPMISTDLNIDIMQRAVQLLENGVFDQRQLVTHRHDAQDAQRELELATERPDGYIKGVLLFGS